MLVETILLLRSVPFVISQVSHAMLRSFWQFWGCGGNDTGHCCCNQIASSSRLVDEIINDSQVPTLFNCGLARSTNFSLLFSPLSLEAGSGNKLKIIKHSRQFQYRCIWRRQFQCSLSLIRRRQFQRSGRTFIRRACRKASVRRTKHLCLTSHSCLA